MEGMTMNLVDAAMTPAADSNSKNPAKLAEAAKGFESLMIAQMMKSARDSSGGGWLSDGDETGEDSSMSLAEEQFAKSLASAGGLGLAKMVIRTMSHTQPAAANVESQSDSK